MMDADAAEASGRLVQPPQNGQFWSTLLMLLVGCQSQDLKWPQHASGPSQLPNAAKQQEWLLQLTLTTGPPDLYLWPSLISTMSIVTGCSSLPPIKRLNNNQPVGEATANNFGRC